MRKLHPSSVAAPLLLHLVAMSGCGVAMEGATASESSALTVPSGYKIKAQSASRNVMVYRRTNHSWYVTVVDTRSATLRSLIGAIDPMDSSLATKTQAEFWTQATLAGMPMVVINMAFFGYGDGGSDTSRAGIAYGLQVSSPSYLASGSEPVGDRYTLGWNKADRADIWDSPDGAGRFDPRGYSDAVGGISADDCKRCADSTGRTFVGVEGDYLLVFSADSATSKEAREELGRWGPTAMMQHDGGGSSFLIVNGTGLVNTDGRKLPHAVAVDP